MTNAAEVKSFAVTLPSSIRCGDDAQLRVQAQEKTKRFSELQSSERGPSVAEAITAQSPSAYTHRHSESDNVLQQVKTDQSPCLCLATNLYAPTVLAHPELHNCATMRHELQGEYAHWKD
jgi:hypothetical protein